MISESAAGWRAKVSFFLPFLKPLLILFHILGADIYILILTSKKSVENK